VPSADMYTSGMSNQLPFGLTFGTTVRDSLYDIIPLSAEATAILSTATFQRLEGIQQLGFVSRVWPGARHTRFEHSLGVMHLMTRALVELAGHGADIDDETGRAGIAAALLHDIGHYPFSHAIEELGPPVPIHEDVGRRLILSEEIAPILTDKWRVDPRRVAWLVEPDGDPLDERDRLIHGLLSGPLDVDKLDYLPRDARACHVPYGGVDTARLLAALRVVEVDGRRSIGIDEKGISPLHSLINARQEMFDNVYWHHTNRACMAMLLRAVQDAVLAGMPADELTLHTDHSLLDRLSQDNAPDTTRDLIDRIRYRRIYKRAVQISSRSGELYRYLGALFHDQSRRREVELDIVARLREEARSPVGNADVLIDIPKPERWSTDLWVQYETPPVGFSSLMTWHDVAGASSDDFKRYEEHRRLIRIVVHPDHRDIVSTNWERLLYPLLIVS
jgi:uncharacterized protein